MRKLFLLATVAMVAGITSSAAFAADPTPPPLMAYDWTGFYVGGNMGYTWGDADLNVTHLPTQAAFGANPYSASLSPDGFIGGVQAGYNFQSGSFVYGLEADIQAAHAEAQSRFGPLILFGGAPMAGSFGIARSELDALGTLRARVGFAADNALFYITGGLAFGYVKDYSRAQYNFGAGNAFNYIGTTGHSWRTGWTLGGGLEYAIDQNWSVKGEYLYYDLGDHSVTAPPVAPNPPFATVNKWDNTGHIVRVGLNYRF